MERILFMNTLLSKATFNVKYVAKGEMRAHGELHDKDDPIIEFYDARRAGAQFGEHGQYIASYYLSSLAERQSGSGLQLHGAVPSWAIDGESMDAIMSWISRQN